MAIEETTIKIGVATAQTDEKERFANIAMRSFFDEGATLSIDFRREQLKKLKAAIEEREDEIYAALHSDLRKSKGEAYITEIGLSINEIDHALKNLKEWARPKSKATPIALEPSSNYVRHEPKGIVLIISPWNYPFMLCIAPLVGAIAAGNCCILKPSEESVHTSVLMEEMLGEIFSQNYIKVVQGIGKDVVPKIVEQNLLNHIFFTGSPAVGRIIAKMAAEKLTSTTLELGGKSPTIVDATANLDVAASRIAFGKFTCAGQTCVSPDYLLLEAGIADEFIEKLKAIIKKRYGDDAQQSTAYPRIINEKRFDTLMGYLSMGNVEFGGSHDRDDLYIEPTLITSPKEGSAILEEEIFGPILPIIRYSDQNELLAIIRKNRYPLALYYFGEDKSVWDFLEKRVEFGGGISNHTLLQFGNPDLPVGGVQTSGNGNYHGFNGFAAFSHAKSIVKTSTIVNPNLLFPPYSSLKLTWLKRIMKL